jgi:alpha-N-arabinofuranosidase
VWFSKRGKNNGLMAIHQRITGHLQTLVFLIALCAPLVLAQDDSVPATISIDASKVEGEISPILYGQFDEFMFEGVKGGLFAELIRDRGFNEAPNAIGLPRYWEREPDDRNDDPALHFRWDDSVFYPRARDFQADRVEHSLRVDVTSNDGQQRGIRQGGIPVRQGVSYYGYLWLKASSFSGELAVALEADQTGGATYARAQIQNIAGEWKKYEFTLTPTKTDPLAKFVVLFHGRGRIWLDQVSLLPGNAVDGVRADVFQKIKALRPAFVRWPGGNVAQD